MYSPEIGSQINRGGKQVIKTEPDRHGIAVYGPYETYDAGRYLINFNIEIEAFDASYRDTVVAIIEVTGDNGAETFARSQVFASRILRDTGVITLGFLITRRMQLEFRVHVTGRASLLIDLDRNAEKIEADTEDYSPTLDRLAHGRDEFFQNNLGHFRGMYEHGASLNVTDKGTIAAFNNIRFYMRSIEDFQVVNEVFIYHDYNFTSARNAIAVDVGMNVGLTSLYMASLPSVKEVHAFEPFGATIERARENIDLNPTLSPKIKYNRFGLGYADEELTIYTDDNQTIANSVKSVGGSIANHITIRDACVIFAEICSRAEANGLDVVVKMDCEGSEFPILRRIDEAGLLRRIDVLMLEWHKHWSSQLTSRHIVERLKANGFTVFDRTHAHDFWAGQLYAVRSDQRNHSADVKEGA